MIRKADDLQAPAPRPPSSRIAICAWTLRPNDPDHLVKRLRNLNIRSVQINLSQIIDEPADWSDLIDHLRSSEIWVSSGTMMFEGDDYPRGEQSHNTGLLSDRSWFANRSHAERVARLADRAAVPLISTQIGSIPTDPDSPEWAKLLDRVGAIAEIFSHYGLQLAVETGQAAVHLLDVLLDQLALPNLGVNFDPAGIVLANLGDPIAALKNLLPRVRQVHVRDAIRPSGLRNVGRETTVGRGEINWDAFFDLATAISPPVQFVIERDPRIARDEDIAAARDLIAYHLAPNQASKHLNV